MATKTKTLSFNRPRLFSPSHTRQVLEDGSPVLRQNLDSLKDTNIESTSSFRYDPPGFGIRSSQQIPVDFSRFENHTFFGSAEANVNVAFDKIINSYPFDGTQKQLEKFLDDLTGFEKYVLDEFPKNTQYLNFSGSWIEIKDIAGNLFPELSRNNKGESILNPGTGSLSVEFHLMVPTGSDGIQILFQKMSGSNQGFVSYLSSSVGSTTYSLSFEAVSGSDIVSTVSSLDKNSFDHIVLTFDRSDGSHAMRTYVNESLVGESANSINMGDLDIESSPLTIGTGSAFASESGTIEPTSTMIGALDELRWFHDIRSVHDQERLGRKNIFASDSLKLYLKFNEPVEVGSTNESINRTVLDSSGNSLHATVTNFTASLRNDDFFGFEVMNPMSFEKSEFNPVLFPTYPEVIDLNTTLLTTASAYDLSNPNLITRLVPDHYFLEGQLFEAFEDEEGTIADSYGGTGIPGSGEIGSAQLMSTFLFVWAKFFDELKLNIDAFGRILHVDYDDEETVPDQFLPFLAKYTGLHLPDLFRNAGIEQFIDAENINADIGTSELSLQAIQNQIWRRILTNANDILRSKGTLHSVKSAIRSIGIDPDGIMRFREYGGPTKRKLGVSRENRTEVSTLLDFSGTLANVPLSVGPTGVPTNKPFISSDFLVADQRIEPGFPEALGNTSDVFLTSGSFTFEGIYSFPSNLVHPATQSLVRLHNTGSTLLTPRILTNLIATSGSDPKLKLFSRPGFFSSPGVNSLTLDGVDIFDGNKWSISFGRFRYDDPALDDILNLSPETSSSYFLRAARQEFGEIKEVYITQSLFEPTEPDVFSNLSTLPPTNGPVIAIGSQSIDTASSLGLNGSALDPETKATEFSGRVGHLRFWSKGLLEEEWREHVRNYRSLGVQDPLTNFNFVTTNTGSFERNRIDVTTDQIVTSSDVSGDIVLFDFSQNLLHFSGSGFEPDTEVIKPETFRFGFLSPRFDEGVTNQKVRSRGFQDFDLVSDSPYAQVSPVYEINRSEMPEDDVRFSVDFSIVDALDQDIISIFSTLDALDNILGDPNMVFAGDYPGLEDLRDVYFNRLTDKINLKGFFDFFRWFDTSMGMIIEQLIPRKTKFFGVNFVIESHMLERSRFEYLFNDIYLGESDRNRSRGTILLQQFAGQMRRY